MKYNKQHFTGERALFKQNNIEIDNCLFDDGESPLKEGNNITVANSTFGYKYPLWYGNNHKVNDCTFLEMSRSGIWYTNNSTFKNLNLIAPKLFRRCENILIEDCEFKHASETLWTCSNVKLNNLTINEGDYFGKDSSFIEASNITLNGNYCFDGGHDIKVSNSTFYSKDAFWNCNNSIIENSKIIGEYFGWNSKNITLKNCHIESHQGFCYIENLTLIDCTISNSDLIFEYCKNINITVDSDIDSVKNPISGNIICNSIKELILDDNNIDFNNVNIKELKNEF